MTDATVLDVVVNVRSGPGTKNKVIGKLDNGDKVTIIERKPNWYHVAPKNGSKRGWVYAGSLRINAAAPPKPVPPPPVIPPDVSPIEEAEAWGDKQPTSKTKVLLVTVGIIGLIVGFAFLFLGG